MTATLEAPSDLLLAFDGESLARAWLAVSLAASKDLERPALDRALGIEWFPNGVRLVATDGHMLLHSWVPALPATETAPGLDEAPQAVLAALDPYDRAKNLLKHVLALTKPKDAPAVHVSLSSTELDSEANTFEGLEGRAVALELPGTEQLRLRVYEGEWVDWRPLVGGFRAETTDRVALNPELVGRLVKCSAFCAGVISWEFGGAAAPARVAFLDAYPEVAGLIMPLRVDFTQPEPTDDEILDRIRDELADEGDGAGADDAANETTDDDYEERLKADIEAPIGKP